MTWDPFGTVHKALWIGGAPWAGKSTVARLLAARHGLTTYHHDYHDTGGTDGDEARPAAAGDPETWVHTTAERMLSETLAEFSLRFTGALDDLRALMSPHPIVAEGRGLRPDLVAPEVDSPGRMVVLVPTELFRQHQLRQLPWAASVGSKVSDPERAQRNRVARDRLLAADAVRSARKLGIRVIEIDGSLGPEDVTDVVDDHFAGFLPG